MVLYFGSQIVTVKMLFVVEKRWGVWFSALKDVHPAAIVLRLVRF